MSSFVSQFLREQGILIVMGWMLLAGILHQITAGRRYRRLRGAIQSMGAGEEKIPQRKIRRRERKRGFGQPVHSPSSMAFSEGSREGDYEAPYEAAPMAVQNHVTSHGQKGTAGVQQESELDAQLQYLKQSLDRIAAGRDQKLEEEVKERPRRKLTPEQEAVIGEILREYLT